MNEIVISDKISYIEMSNDPLSADVGIIKENGVLWLYDVGNGENEITRSNEKYNVVLSHFHADHITNIDRINTGDIYLSKETFRHVQKRNIVTDSLTVGNLHIFTIPSSHSKGSLCLEVDGEYAFVGDALYCKSRNGCGVYNSQLLKDEIEALEKLRAGYLLVSHHKGLVRKKEDVINELESIYKMRKQNDPEIIVTD